MTHARKRDSVRVWSKRAVHNLHDRHTCPSTHTTRNAMIPHLVLDLRGVPRASPSARRVLRSREPRVRRGAGPPSCGDETRDHAPRRRARGRFGICSETQARKPYSLPWSGNISSPLPNSPGERHGERTVVARSAPRQGQRDRAHGTTRSVARAHLFREGLGEHGARAALGDGRGR